MNGITGPELKEAHAADPAHETAEKVRFEGAAADPDSRTVYRLSTGPSAEAVQRVHERSGHKADEIHAVPPAVRRPNVSRPDVRRPDVRRPDVRRPDARRPDISRAGRAPPRSP